MHLKTLKGSWKKICFFIFEVKKKFNVLKNQWNFQKKIILNKTFWIKLYLIKILKAPWLYQWFWEVVWKSKKWNQFKGKEV